MTFYSWSTTAATNNTADSSINWQEGQAPSTLNNSARAMMAALAKYRIDMAGTITTGGSSTAYTATSNQAYTANGDGHTITVELHTASGASPTLNVDGRGAQAILLGTSGSAPAAGTLISGGIYRLTDNGSAWIINGYIAPSSTVTISNIDLIGGTQLTDPAIDDTLLIYDLSATANKRILTSDFMKIITDLTAETAVATDDELPIFDTSETAANKMTTTNLFKIVNGFTEDSSPDEDADFLLSYDTSASAPKKVKPANLIIPGAIIAIIEEQQTSGTEGGTFTAGSDVTRTLNTLVYNRDTLVSLSSNRFTLPAGDWEIEWSAPAYAVERHQSLLHNQTDASDVKRGTTEQGATAGVTTRSHGRARVSIAGSKAFEIRHRSSVSNSGDGLGSAASLGTEIYTQVIVRKG